MTDSAPPTETGCTPAPTAAAQVRHFRYYDLVMAAFVAILLLSNIIGASKPSYIPMPDGSQWAFGAGVLFFPIRSEEHTSELQSLMRISYAVFCLKKKKNIK